MLTYCEKFLRVPFWLGFCGFISANSYLCKKMRGFIFANEWIFDMERPQKQEKTNEIDTF